MSPEVGEPDRRACHRPDRGRSGYGSKLGGVVEAKLAVEGAGVGERRLEVAEAVFAISSLEYRVEELSAEAALLFAWLDPHERQVPVRIARVLRRQG